MKYLQDKTQRVLQVASEIVAAITIIAVPIILSIEQKRAKPSIG